MLEKLPVEAVVTILMRAVSSLGIQVLDSSRPADPEPRRQQQPE